MWHHYSLRTAAETITVSVSVARLVAIAFATTNHNYVTGSAHPSSRPQRRSPFSRHHQCLRMKAAVTQIIYWPRDRSGEVSVSGSYSIIHESQIAVDWQQNPTSPGSWLVPQLLATRYYISTA